MTLARARTSSEGAAVRIAHAYGNTRKALRQALAASIDVIEADVWFRGKDLHLRHERRLEPLPLLVDRRMKGHTLPPMTVPLWRGYYVRVDVNPMRLAEALEVAGGKLSLLLDIKGAYDEIEANRFASALARQIADRRAESWAAVCGQFWPVLHRLREIAPAIEVRYSIETPKQWERFVMMAREDGGARKVCMEHGFLSEGKERFLREHGVSVYCWTVDDAGTAARLLAMGVDGIISNDLGLLAGLGRS